MTSTDISREAMRVIISLGLVGAGLFVLVSGTGSEELGKAASGWLGLVFGHWFK